MATGQMECPICGYDKPHHHEAKTVELERYARPAFETWVEPRLRHIGKEDIGQIAVHYGLAFQGWEHRHSSGYYLENSIEAAWQAFSAAWLASDATMRRPR